MAKAFNGHRSWNAWNVSLWINNDEGLYRWARELEGQKTPDGGRYNVTTIWEAMDGIAS